MGQVMMRRLELVSKRPSFEGAVATFSHSIPDSVIYKLGKILDMSAEEIKEKVNLKAEFTLEPILLKSDVNSETITKIEENRKEFSKIVIKVQPIRKYLYQDFAAHVFGYVGEIDEIELKDKKK